MAAFVDLSAMIDGRKKKIIKDFGNRLKKIRKEKKMSLRGLAAASSLEHAQISKMEKVGINVTLTTIADLADALGIKPADLL